MIDDTNRCPKWARSWLIAAGVYNLVWGAAVIVFPNLLFDLAGMERPNYPQLWQCIGMIVGVYGIGYLIAAGNPRVHWPIVLVGLLGKVFGPIGFVGALVQGTLPPAFGWTIVTNDLIWWAPFALILWDAARSRGAERAPSSADRALDDLVDQQGRTLRQISDEAPTLVLLTRHSGCTFCHEMLAELAQMREAIVSRGYAIVVVTMSSDAKNQELAKRHALVGAHWISDPQRLAYTAFDIPRGRFAQLFGPAVILGGARATIRGHLPGKLDGDGLQMPGTLVLHRGQVVRQYMHKHAADHADLDQLTCEPIACEAA